MINIKCPKCKKVSRKTEYKHKPSPSDPLAQRFYCPNCGQVLFYQEVEEKNTYEE